MFHSWCRALSPSSAAHHRPSYMPICSDEALDLMSKRITQAMQRSNGLMIVNAILMAVVVGIGAYAPRYRYHPFVRFLFLGAATLFLPIVSAVAGTIGSQYFNSDIFNFTLVVSLCQPSMHIILVLVWTGLVVTIGINISITVAADSREGTSAGFPTDLLLKAVWTAYLILSTTSTQFFTSSKNFLGHAFDTMKINRHLNIIFLPIYGLTFSKLVLRYYALHVAQRSVAFGRNPSLIQGHMAHLDLVESRNAEQIDEHTSPPALVVKGEDAAKVEKKPHGYSFKSIDSGRVVTIDSVWKLDDIVLRSEPKDLCLSFALFKLLRCRFAKCTVLEAGFMKVQKFFRYTYLQGDDYERVFRVIADELSFIHDYYYSSLPVSYSRRLLPFIYTLLSLCSICYSSYMFVFLSQPIDKIARLGNGAKGQSQAQCLVFCPNQKNKAIGNGMKEIIVGSKYFDTVPVYLVLALLMLSEMRDIVFYICSNWTKVALFCNYITHTSWQQSPMVQRCIGFVLKYCSCKMMNNSGYKMSQRSILVFRRRCLFPWRSYQRKMKVPSVVKAAIFEAFKDQTIVQEEGLKKIWPPIFPIPSFISTATNSDDTNSISAYDSKGTANIILVWHIATCIFEVRHPQQSDARIAAAHLSRYCAYLVSCHPELLPGDNEWCKSLYKAVKKDADRVLVGCAAQSTPEADYQLLVDLLKEKSKHKVLKRGATLGQELVESNTGWKKLEGFWSKMILYLAPSENLDGHKEAIARGGELITLLWAMLAHDGIVGRPDAAGFTSASGDFV